MMGNEYLQVLVAVDSANMMIRELALNGWMVQTRDGSDDAYALLTFTRPVFARPLVSVFPAADDDELTTTAAPPVFAPITNEDTEMDWRLSA